MRFFVFRLPPFAGAGARDEHRIFSRRTNRMQEALVYSHDGPIRRRKSVTPSIQAVVHWKKTKKRLSPEAFTGDARSCRQPAVPSWWRVSKARK
eukprot:238296-Prorocentrum_minimum.AAC.2